MLVSGERGEGGQEEQSGSGSERHEGAVGKVSEWELLRGGLGGVMMRARVCRGARVWES